MRLGTGNSRTQEVSEGRVPAVQAVRGLLAVEPGNEGQILVELTRPMALAFAQAPVELFGAFGVLTGRLLWVAVGRICRD